MSKGRFGPYGGQFVPETLMAAVTALEEGYGSVCSTSEFRDELAFYLKEYAGRETPLTFCRNVSADMGCKVYLKREDLLHSGAHKLNNTLGQALLARHMGKKRLIAETGAGQHGVATAIAGAVLDLPVEVYMGETDCRRQQLNVFRMELLGAKVIPVTGGTATLKDAVNEAMREWAASSEDSAYILGSVVGPHPYPEMVRDFQTVIGKEARAQVLEREGCLPDEIIACVGGGSNAIGMFHPFLKDNVALTGVEAGGRGNEPGEHGASLEAGRPGILHGALSYLLQDDDGQVIDTYSVAAGLDYPAVGPEHSMLKDTGRVRYESVRDDAVLRAFRYLSRREGIVPALESSHAVAYLMREQGRFEKDDIVIVNLSGRGDKDISREVVHEQI
ncbi:tryptophan synthase subunit beta [Methanogenium sp. S4BF]|uniref:tryptophan synthase subunit beta n=1 Tax=Methanogenium sp. S4BF TaxID=1789226 RepID=UPI0024165C90|nr:tryptophan synthase subunit beta [Methanogenium sp. S4BF]WFN33700.1 tryptophan synthase subunit beta [Methanogenium sp. S4BF]